LRGDPLGAFTLEHEHIEVLTRLLVERAEQWCEGRVVSALEGGYDPERLAVACVQHMRALEWGTHSARVDKSGGDARPRDATDRCGGRADLPNVVVYSTADLEVKAIRSWLERYGDQDVSCTDAVSFAVMTERRIDVPRYFSEVTVLRRGLRK
jgi:hypothetical protein